MKLITVTLVIDCGWHISNLVGLCWEFTAMNTFNMGVKYHQPTNWNVNHHHQPSWSWPYMIIITTNEWGVQWNVQDTWNGMYNEDMHVTIINYHLIILIKSWTTPSSCANLQQRWAAPTTALPHQWSPPRSNHNHENDLKTLHSIGIAVDCPWLVQPPGRVNLRQASTQRHGSKLLPKDSLRFPGPVPWPSPPSVFQHAQHQLGIAFCSWKTIVDTFQVVHLANSAQSTAGWNPRDEHHFKLLRKAIV